MADGRSALSGRSSYRRIDKVARISEAKDKGWLWWPGGIDITSSDSPSTRLNPRPDDGTDLQQGARSDRNWCKLGQAPTKDPGWGCRGAQIKRDPKFDILFLFRGPARKCVAFLSGTGC
jgi:hypothetical protein